MPDVWRNVFEDSNKSQDDVHCICVPIALLYLRMFKEVIYEYIKF